MTHAKDSPREDTPAADSPAEGSSAESVWDYPRPPAVVRCDLPVQIRFGGGEIASTTQSLRVLETSHPPTFYLPIDSFVPGALQPVATTTTCEFKGQAHYFDVCHGGQRARRAAWQYPQPRPGYETLADHVAVMPGAMEACFVANERVAAQEGDFYGGWITSAVAGPFKGAPGTWGW